MQGLSSAEAARRLARDGYNELRVRRGTGVLRAVAALAREPLFLLLFAAAAVYLWLGERTDAIALLASTLAAAAITVAQKVRTERVLLALRDLSSPRTRVLRDGSVQRVASRELVRDDVLLLAEGDRVPADAQVLEAHELRVDESLLTGESAPVHKFAAGTTPQADAHLYANTLVVAGSARAVVTAVASRTQVGGIAEAVQGLGEVQTPLQRDTAQLARWFGAGGLAVSLLLVLGHGFAGQWTDGLLRGLTLAMAILPEEFPLVITVFLALGAWRLAGRHVLARRAGAIEALGATTLLAVDKTGTLTCNRMRLARVVAADGSVHDVGDDAAPSPLLQELARAAALASDPQPFDPMEQACRSWASRALALPGGERLKRRYPLTPERLMLGHAWEGSDGWTVAVKGAPEHVAAACALDEASRAALLRAARALADDGLRVLAVASADVAGDRPPDGLEAVPLRCMGLIAFDDPLRPEVPDAVRACHRAGVRVMMITGDYPVTAAAVARSAGIAAQPRVVDGATLAQWDDATLGARLPDIDVVARATPLAKLRLVQRLQHDGHVVAMTGDGVNDAPALRAAHIGVAMGQRGSDVAREAASLVLLRDDFGSLVAAIAQGRRIFANLRQALLYVLAVHVPLVGVSLLPLLAGGAPLLLPLHVMFLEFVIDPACSLAFENEPDRADPMAGPPRDVREHVLGLRQIAAALLQGVIAFAAAATVAFALHAGAGEGATRAAAVTSIVLTNIALIVRNRSARTAAPNAVLWGIVGATLLAWTAVLAWPPLRGMFRLELPDWPLAAVTLASVLAALTVLAVLPRARRAA